MASPMRTASATTAGYFRGRRGILCVTTGGTTERFSPSGVYGPIEPGALPGASLHDRVSRDARRSSRSSPTRRRASTTRRGRTICAPGSSACARSWPQPALDARDVRRHAPHLRSAARRGRAGGRVRAADPRIPGAAPLDRRRHRSGARVRHHQEPDAPAPADAGRGRLCDARGGDRTLPLGRAADRVRPRGRGELRADQCGAPRDGEPARPRSATRWRCRSPSRTGCG